MLIAGEAVKSKTGLLDGAGIIAYTGLYVGVNDGVKTEGTDDGEADSANVLLNEGVSPVVGERESVKGPIARPGENDDENEKRDGENAATLRLPENANDPLVNEVVAVAGVHELAVTSIIGPVTRPS